MSLEIPLVEKFRSMSFKQIVSLSLAINFWGEFIKTPTMPHMIFAGHVGTGKTSTPLIIAKTFLRNDVLSTNLLEVNAYLQLADININNYLKNEEKDSVFHRF